MVTIFPLPLLNNRSDRPPAGDTLPPRPRGLAAVPHGEDGLQGEGVLHAPHQGGDADAAGRLYPSGERAHGGYSVRRKGEKVWSLSAKPRLFMYFSLCTTCLFVLSVCVCLRVFVFGFAVCTSIY